MNKEKCQRKVYGRLEGTERFLGFKQCSQRPIVCRTDNRAVFCATHARQDGLLATKCDAAGAAARREQGC